MKWTGIVVDCYGSLAYLTFDIGWNFYIEVAVKSDSNVRI